MCPPWAVITDYSIFTEFKKLENSIKIRFSVILASLHFCILFERTVVIFDSESVILNYSTKFKIKKTI